MKSWKIPVWLGRHEIIYVVLTVAWQSSRHYLLSVSLHTSCWVTNCVTAIHSHRIGDLSFWKGKRNLCSALCIKRAFLFRFIFIFCIFRVFFYISSLTCLLKSPQIGAHLDMKGWVFYVNEVSGNRGLKLKLKGISSHEVWELQFYLKPSVNHAATLLMW